MSEPAGDPSVPAQPDLFSLDQAFSRPWVRAEFENTLLVNERFIGPENARRLSANGIANYLAGHYTDRLQSLAESHEIGLEVPIFSSNQGMGCGRFGISLGG